MKKISSNTLKYAVLKEFKFNRHTPYIATEVGRFKSDVLCIDNADECYEFEVKIDKYDIIADFKKPKHNKYLKYSSKLEVPNYFYFVIPNDLTLLQTCKDLIKKYNNKYGIFIYRNGVLVLKKKALKLHKELATQSLKRRILLRMGSLIVSSYEKI